MKIYSKDCAKRIYKVAKKLSAVKCDVCGKHIEAVSWPTPPAKYYEVCTGHHDWGNDSCDSIRYTDICPDCISAFVSEYLKTKSTTAYIEIKTETAYPIEAWFE